MKSKPNLEIMLRVNDPTVASRLRDLAATQNLSLNMTVQLLVNFAFDELDAHPHTTLRRKSTFTRVSVDTPPTHH